MSSTSAFFKQEENAKQENVQQVLGDLAKYLSDTQPSVRGVASMASRQGDARKEGSMIKASGILSHIEKDLFANGKTLQLFSETLQQFTSKEVQTDSNASEASYSPSAPAA